MPDIIPISQYAQAFKENLQRHDPSASQYKEELGSIHTLTFGAFKVIDSLLFNILKLRLET